MSKLFSFFGSKRMDGTVFFTGSDDHTRQSIEILASAMGYTTRSDLTPQNIDEVLRHDESACIVLNSGFLELKQALAWAEEIIRRQSDARIILLCSDCETREVVNAMRLGLSSVLEYPFSYAELEQAIHLAMEENRQRLQRLKNQLAPDVAALLNKQEQEIAQMLLEGAGTKQISVKLDLSIRTIHYRKKAMFRKLGACGRSAALETLLGSTQPRSSSK